jgi:ADP-heptose:LPS heptosyltransferase
MRRGSRSNRVLDFWVGIPLLNLLATLRWRQQKPAQVKRVGVMCSPALGDTLLFSGALRDVRAHYGNGVEVIHVCMKSSLAAAELLGGASRRVVIDLTDPIGTIRQLHAEKLDIMLDFSSWQRLTAFYTMMSGARFTAGFQTAGMHRARGYDLAVEHRADRHEVENFRKLLAAVGVQTGLMPELRVPAGPKPLAEAQDLVVFHLWASGQRSWLREWPEDRWIELGRRLAEQDTVFAITGSPADVARSEPFVARMQADGLNAVVFAGSDGLAGVARLARRARLVVSVNTGVMHLAAILGAPTVSINGPTNNERWGPVGVLCIGVQPVGSGCGYLNLGFEFEGQPTDCMERISVDQVFRAAQALSIRGTRESA